MHRLFLAASAFAVASVSATADTHNTYPFNNSIYFGPEIGATFAEPNRQRTDQGADITDNSKMGWLGGFVLGYDMHTWRLEMGYRHRQNNLSEIDVTSAGPLPLAPNQSVRTDGKLKSQTISVTALKKIADLDKWRAFLGLGIGLTHGDYTNFRTESGIPLSKANLWEASGHVSAQISRQIADNMTFDMGYRYQHALKDRWRTAIGLTDFSLDSHDVFANLKWHFGGSKPKAKPAKFTPPPPKPAPQPIVEETPPPPPPAPPEPEPVVIPGPFIVFFDFDSSTITSQADLILQAAAKAYEEFDIRHLLATGHTDSSGPAAYNSRLAEQRVNAVKARLMELGVADANILTDSKGEAEQLVSTADNVREAQNRRVEIILHNP